MRIDDYLVPLNANTVSWRRLSGNRKERLSDLQGAFKIDSTTYPKDNSAWAFSVYRFTQAARTGVIQIGDK